MRDNHSLEIGTGAFVLLGLAALLFLTTQLPSSGLKLTRSKSGYHITAAFDNIGDLKTGSPVTLAGVNIGEVEDIRIDPQRFKAVVRMRIDPQYSQIPDDSDVSVQTQGLLGGKYIGVGPGGSETFWKDGSSVQFTQSAIGLESIINKLFASFASKGESGPTDSGAAAGSSGASAGSATAPPKKEASK